MKLLSSHDLSSFDATEEDGSDPVGLQEFIQQEALKYQEENLGVTYLMMYEDHPVAFLTVAMGNITPTRLKNHERVTIRRKITHSYPSLLLGRLAVDKRWRSRGIGEFVLRWVLGHTRWLARHVGCRYVCLHCRDQTAPYYAKLGFQLCEPRRGDRFRLMYIKCAS